MTQTQPLTPPDDSPTWVASEPFSWKTKGLLVLFLAASLAALYVGSEEEHSYRLIEGGEHRIGRGVAICLIVSGVLIPVGVFTWLYVRTREVSLRRLMDSGVPMEELLSLIKHATADEEDPDRLDVEKKATDGKSFVDYVREKKPPGQDLFEDWVAANGETAPTDRLVLHRLAARGDARSVHNLLHRHKLNPLEKSGSGRLAIEEALDSGDKETISVLINAAGPNKQTALALAQAEGRTDLVEKLKAHGGTMQPPST